MSRLLRHLKRLQLVMWLHAHLSRLPHRITAQADAAICDLLSQAAALGPAPCHTLWGSLALCLRHTLCHPASQHCTGIKPTSWLGHAVLASFRGSQVRRAQVLQVCVSGACSCYWRQS